MHSVSGGLSRVNALLALACGGPTGSRATHPSKPWVLSWHAAKHTLGTGCGGWYTAPLATALL